jgi:cytochrome-b5 reductase
MVEGQPAKLIFRSFYEPNYLMWAAVIAVPLLLYGLLLLLRGPPKTLKAKQKVALRLAKKEQVSWDTRKFTFALPSPQHVLGLPVGKHVAISAMVPNPRTGADKKYIARSYTPVTLPDTKGYVELVIKVYFKDQHPHFPDGGWFSQYLENLNVGEYVDWRGPMGKIHYVQKGVFDISGKQQTFKRVGMIAGGTGITPMFQLMAHCAAKEDRALGLHLLFANKSPEDILIEDELRTLDKEANMKVHFTVDKGNAKWKGYTGFVTKQMLEETMPPPGKDTLILLCGPPVMTEKCVKPLLAELGYEHVHNA